MFKRILGIACLVVVCGLIVVLTISIIRERSITVSHIPILGGISVLAITGSLLLKKDEQKKTMPMQKSSNRVYLQNESGLHLFTFVEEALR